MRLYLDLNCFNRPFDDQTQDRVARETAAVLWILQRIVDRSDELAWSTILSYENSQHPLADRRDEIARWADFAVVTLPISARLMVRARELADQDVPALDAAHVASAEEGGCERFLTCDDRLLRKARRLNVRLAVMNPVKYQEEISNG